MELRLKWNGFRVWLQERFDDLTSSSWLDFLSPEWRSALAYSFRTWIGGSLALYLAFLMQLDSPYWAPVAAWIVAQPTPGMALSKGLYRVVGTIIGSFMGLVLIALFAQTPELFIVALALWVGACTVVANLLRNFRSYGAALAGYTAAIVALASYADPEHVFYVATARGTCTILGIMCAALVTSVLAPHHAREQVLAKLKAVMGDGARRAVFPLAGGSPEDGFVLGKKLIDDLIALDTSIEFASAESAEFRIHANRARGILAELFGVISSTRALESIDTKCGPLPPGPLADIRDACAKLLVEVPGIIAHGDTTQLVEDLKHLHSLLLELDPEEAPEVTPEVVRQRLYIDHLVLLLGHMHRAVADERALTGPWENRPVLRLDFHRDHRAAWINGLRAMTAILVAGAFWIATAWSTGAGMLIQVAVVCSFFSTLPRPDLAGATFLVGGFLGCLIAFPFTYLILQSIGSNFDLLILCMGLVLIPCHALSSFPKWTLFAFPLCVYFIITVQPLNVMDYNIISFLNNTLASIIGIGFGTAAYILILPKNPQAAHDYVLHRIRRGFEILAAREPTPPNCVWQSRMFDRVSRLYNWTESTGPQREKWMASGLEALNAGNEILQLRRLLRDEPVSPPLAKIIRFLLHDFSDFRQHPTRTIESLRESLDQIREIVPPTEREPRRTYVRIRGAVAEMNEFFASHPQYFRLNSP